MQSVKKVGGVLKDRLNLKRTLVLGFFVLAFLLSPDARAESSYWKNYFSSEERKAVVKNAEKYTIKEIKTKSKKWKGIIRGYNIKNGTITDEDIKDDGISTDKISGLGDYIDGKISKSSMLQDFSADKLVGSYAALNGSQITNLNPSNITGSGNLNIGNGDLFVDDASGKVGIGTTSPGAKLDVTGGQIFNGDGSLTAPAYSFGNSNNTGIYRNASGLVFGIGGSQIVRLYSTFIGLDKGVIMQNTSGTELDFQGTLNNTTMSTQSSMDININSNSGTPGSHTFRVNSPLSGALLTVHDFGVVQLGYDTSSPVSQEIKSSDNNTQGAGSDFLIKSGESFGANATGGTLRLRGGQSTGSVIGGDIIFQSSVAGSEGNSLNTIADLLTIKGGGNVGIGTTDPKTKLEVDGIIKTKKRATATCDADSEGGIYYDSDDKHFYGCNGTTWTQLDM